MRVVETAAAPASGNMLSDGFSDGGSIDSTGFSAVGLELELV